MIDILMATYNGEKYIAQQIDSILRQDEGNWQLIISDDGSRDETASMIDAYVNKESKRVARIEIPHEKGPVGNFLSLLAKTKGEYTMFSDQDDIWHANKVSTTLRAMEEAEIAYGKECPILVHSDLAVVDSGLKGIHPSFMQFQGLNPQCQRFENLVSQNNVTGCTMMMNRPLTDLVKRAATKDVLMHDWWAALVAAMFGKIVYIPEALIDYRQHESNQLGATGNNVAAHAMEALSNMRKAAQRIHKTYGQAAAFEKCYGHLLSQDQQRRVNRYASLLHKGKIKRAYTIVRYRYFKQTGPRVVGQVLFC